MPVATAADYVVALYDFQAVNADELNLQEGDTILVTKRDDSGWWEGKFWLVSLFPLMFYSLSFALFRGIEWNGRHLPCKLR